MISFKLFKEGYTSGEHDLSPEQMADHAEHAKTFGERDKEHIKNYKRQSSYWNNPLRHKGNDRASYDRAYTSALHGNQMDPAADRAKEMDPITNHPMKHHHTLYRSFQDHSHEMMRSLKVGDTFTDHGYVGTSTNRTQAQRFAQPIRIPGATWDQPEDHISKPANWEHHYAEIHAPAGTRGHYLDMHPYHSHDEENEVLLHRGTKFQVTHHTQHEGPDPYNANGDKPFKFHVTHLKVVGNENV